MDLFMGLVTLTIFTLMLTIGVNQSFHQLTSLWHKRSELFKALFAVVVLVPAIVFLLMSILDLSPHVSYALALLAAAPGAPLTTQRSHMVLADPEYTSSLQLILALLAIVITPVLLSVFDVSFDLGIAEVHAFHVAQQIITVTFLPVVIGLLVQYFAPNLKKIIQKPLNRIANLLFLIMALGLIAILVTAPELRAQLLLGWPAIIAIVTMAFTAVTVGHLIGGPRKGQRAGLAIACLARNLGLALFIAGLSGQPKTVLPSILVYMLLGIAVQVIYSVWLKRQPE
jgi:BASS family bile acid:Na+ symporter